MTPSQRTKNEKATGAWFIRHATDKDLKRKRSKPVLKVVREK
jgi:hypothetical protein